MDDTRERLPVRPKSIAADDGIKVPSLDFQIFVIILMSWNRLGLVSEAQLEYALVYISPSAAAL